MLHFVCEYRGDFGPTSEGYVRYWISSVMNAPRESENVRTYFKDTGEFRMVTGSPIITYSSSLKRGVDLAMEFPRLGVRFAPSQPRL